MRTRHRLALVCVLAALLILYGRDHLQPWWFWNAAYWVLLGIGLITLFRGRRSARGR